MISIGGNDVIMLPHQGNRSHRDRFLANIEMEKTTHLILLILTKGKVLKATNSNHCSIKVDLLLRGQITVHRRTGEIHRSKWRLGGRVLHEVSDWPCIPGRSIAGKS